MRPPAVHGTPGGATTEMANEMFLKYAYDGEFQNEIRAWSLFCDVLIVKWN